EKCSASTMRDQADARLAGELRRDFRDKLAHPLGRVIVLLSPARPSLADSIGGRFDVCDHDIFIRIDLAQQARLGTDVLNKEMPVEPLRLAAANGLLDRIPVW